MEIMDVSLLFLLSILLFVSYILSKDSLEKVSECQKSSNISQSRFDG